MADHPDEDRPLWLEIEALWDECKDTWLCGIMVGMVLGGLLTFLVVLISG